MNPTSSAAMSVPVQIAADAVDLQGDLMLPAEANGIVLFAHGSGSGRHSPRNRFVAEQLGAHGLATLLFDLLTEHEEAIDRYTGHVRFDIDLLANRLVAATDWVKKHPRTSELHIGYFGASTGAAAALKAAARRRADIAAVVSRGGRPDLATSALPEVRAATLLIVGGNDEVVIQLNRQAFDMLRAPHKDLVIVPGASHLFEEPRKLAQVAELASRWFVEHLDHPMDEMSSA